MPKPRNRRVANVPPTDRTAMIDMAAAFGHGARKGKRLVWTVRATQLGENWLADRLENSAKCYWDVRDEALRLAYVVGRWAATFAESKGSSEITENHLRDALNKLGPTGPPGSRVLRGDCPF